MNVCIRCQPTRELTTDAEGKLWCLYHEYQYLLEVRPDPVPEPAVEEQQP